MNLATKMATVAAECVRAPGRVSIWSEQLGTYVCSKDQEFQRAIADQSSTTALSHAPIGSSFKLVFVTAAGGTLLFVLICLITTLLAGRDMPPLTEKIVMAIFDLAKIGFGSVVGLLGAQSLKG